MERWSPFVFPGSVLQCMTGVALTDTSVTVARGRLDGRDFRVEDVVRTTAGDPVARLADPAWAHDGPACVSLPRNRMLVRHFRVPAESTAEIDAMLPHLLAGELPQSLDHYSWVWSRLPSGEDGFTLVAACVARNDQLEAFLEPVAAAGLTVASVVPEGWCRARALERVGGADVAGGEPVDQIIVIQRDGAPYLIVARGGRLLFDMVLPRSAYREDADRDDGLDWDGPGFAEARAAFADLFGRPLSRPQVRSGTGSSDDDAGDGHLAAAVAAVGLERGAALAPPDRLRRSRRRVALGALARLARLGVVAVLAWLVLATVEDGRTIRYLTTLERQIDDRAPRVAVLERESAAIRDNDRERAASTEFLQVLASLRHHVKAPIYLEHLDYVQGRGITLRGGAPANANVLEMTDRLATDPRWRSLRVMQLRSEKIGDADHVHFVVEGRLE